MAERSFAEWLFNPILGEPAPWHPIDDFTRWYRGRLPEPVRPAIRGRALSPQEVQDILRSGANEDNGGAANVPAVSPKDAPFLPPLPPLPVKPGPDSGEAAIARGAELGRQDAERMRAAIAAREANSYDTSKGRAAAKEANRQAQALTNPDGTPNIAAYRELSGSRGQGVPGRGGANGLGLTVAPVPTGPKAMPDNTVNISGPRELGQALAKIYQERDKLKQDRLQLVEDTNGRIRRTKSREMLVDDWLSGSGPGGGPPTREELAAALRNQDTYGVQYDPERVRLAQRLHADQEARQAKTDQRFNNWSQNEQTRAQSQQLGVPPIVASGIVEDRMRQQGTAPMQQPAPGYSVQQPSFGQQARSAWLFGGGPAATMEVARMNNQGANDRAAMTNQGANERTAMTTNMQWEIARLNREAQLARDQGNHQRAMELQDRARQMGREDEVWKRGLPPMPLSASERLTGGVTMAGSENPDVQAAGLGMVRDLTGGGTGAGNMPAPVNPYQQSHPLYQVTQHLIRGLVTPEVASEFNRIANAENLAWGPDWTVPWSEGRINQVLDKIAAQFPGVPGARQMAINWFYGTNGPAKSAWVGAPPVDGTPETYQESLLPKLLNRAWTIQNWAR